jgi:FtsP/CotA-like multicopper oxidase with cupredoxin domain
MANREENDLTVPGMNVDTRPTPIGETRRAFFTRAMAAASSAALASLLPTGTAEAAPPCNANPMEELLTIGTLQRTPADPNVAGTLECVVRMTQESRQIPTGANACSDPTPLKMFEGYMGDKVDPAKKVWPKVPGVPAPGPTLRARVGDTVKLTFVNEVDGTKFPGTREYKGTCDPASMNNPPLVDNNWLPKDDKSPNCFHGSNSGNLHFHGTHVTPSGFGDNVLLQVVPYPDQNPTLRIGQFNHVFSGNPLAPANFPTSMPSGWQGEMTKRLINFDKLNGLAGKPTSLEKQNQDAIKAHEWPVYQPGAFPTFFYITKSTPQHKFDMDQAPGTHWYHAHKHGSTALNLLNGLAGAFVIEGGYDDDLRKWNAKVMDTQKVIVIQEFGDIPNLYRGPVARAMLANGQYQPKITMNQGSIVLLRIVNASQQQPLTLDFTSPQFQVKQIAQDGVQFEVTNYNRQLSGTKFFMAPANRIDLLVKAPNATAEFPVLYKAGPATGNANTLMTLVTSTATENMSFPTDAEFPKFPRFLDDIEPSEIRKYRRLTFGWEQGRTINGRTGPDNKLNVAPNVPPHYTIDGKQFQDHYIDQTMELGSVEEWLIENGTTIRHPFHIHVNPFQVVEEMNPNKTEKGVPIIGPEHYAIFQNPTPQNEPQRMALIAKCTTRDPRPWVIWWDNFAIPAGLSTPDANVPGGLRLVVKPDGSPALAGYFKMWTRFVDFTGKFVLHCHILGHEDRGMMQLVQVIPKPTTTLPHH